MKSNSTITTNNAATSIRTPSSATKLTHHLSFLNGTPSQMADPKNSKAKIGDSSIGGIRRSFMFKSNPTASPKPRPYYPHRSHSTVSHLSCPQSELLKMKVVASICPNTWNVLLCFHSPSVHFYVSFSVHKKSRIY